jgi:hypothetical protein
MIDPKIRTYFKKINAFVLRDNRFKERQRIELATYNDYPDAVSNNAQRGIDLNLAVNNKCATPVGKIRAQQLANKRNISVETIQRMYAYLSRAEEFYNPGDNTACGTISFLLWGGLAGKRWAASKLKELGLLELAGVKLSLITCPKCGHSYESENGGDDLYVCHVCGYDNTPS